MLDDPTTALLTGPLLWFVDWPASAIAVPRSGSAVYTIWERAGAFVYVGTSGRSADARGSGPFGRLNRHAGGRRSGNQFNIHVSNLVVLPRVASRIPEIAAGELSLAPLTREYIRTEHGFRILALPSPLEAFTVERQLRRGEWAAGRPILNPAASALPWHGRSRWQPAEYPPYVAVLFSNSAP